MSNEHAILAPSSADRWVQCSGSVALERLYPELDDTPDAMEGVAAHWAGAEVIQGRKIDVGLIAPNGVVLDAEMCDAAELYAEHVLEAQEFDTVVCVETRLSPGSIHPDNWGTPDVTAWTPRTRTLHVVDFKYGHETIEVFENWQLINYVALVLEQLNVNGADDQITRVHMTIVQPRSYRADGPIRTWSATAADLRPYFNILTARAHDAMKPETPTTVGPACKHCRGRHACPALQRAALSAVDVAGASVPVELPPAALGHELRTMHRAADLLKARITGLEEQALNTLRAGTPVPHFAVEQSKGREAWTKPIDEVIALGQLMGVDIAKPGALTPVQARKAGLDPALVASYAAVPHGAMKLVPASTTQSRKVFGR
jgi:hypothetical protein